MNYTVGTPTDQYVETLRRAPTAADATLWSKSYLDGFGRTFKTLSQGPDATNNVITSQTEFNARGGVERASAPYFPGGAIQWTSYKYDALNRLTKVIHPDATQSLVGYSLAATSSSDILRVTSTDEELRQQIFALDADGNLTKRIKVNGTGGSAPELLTEYRRDRLGRVTQVIDPALNLWDYNYDNLGRRKQVKDPDLGTWTYTFDDASRLSTQTDARGVKTTLTYDDLGRVKTKVVTDLGSNGIATETTTNTYDEVSANGHSASGLLNLGRLTDAQRTVPAHTRSSNGSSYALPAVDVTQRFDYDAAGHLTSRRFLNINGATKMLGYDYWPDGSLKRKQLADGVWTGNFAYDLAGRLASVDDDTSPATNSLFMRDITYNARGQVSKLTSGNNVTSWFTYNEQRGVLNGLETRDGQGGAASLLLGLTYARNAAGMITGVTAAGGTTAQNNARSWTYTYDGIGQLLTADRQDTAGVELTYAYDAASNMIEEHRAVRRQRLELSQRGWLHR
jgi:YD repeat-containing protein